MPIWLHGVIVVTLLTLHAFTFVTMRRRIEGLQDALIAKRVLLEGAPTLVTQTNIAAGDTLSVRDRYGTEMFEVTSSSATKLTLRQMFK